MTAWVKIFCSEGHESHVSGSQDLSETESHRLALEERRGEGSSPHVVCIYIRNHSLSLTLTSVEHNATGVMESLLLIGLRELQSNSHSFEKRAESTEL